MSAIFQEAPPSVIIHPLPSGAKFVTYRFDDLLNLTAWMPPSTHHVSQETRESCDSFYENNCRGCERNCEGFLDPYRDENGYVDWDEVGSHCEVYDEGYNGQDCPLGYSREYEEVDFDLCEIAYSIGLFYRPSNSRNREERIRWNAQRYHKSSDRVFLCGSRVQDSRLWTTDTRLPANVYGYNDNPGGVCWGRVHLPLTLRSIAGSFFSTQFNDDLTSIHDFNKHVSEIDSFIECDDFEENSSENILINNENSEHVMDALVIADAEQHVHAFFTLLSAGFKPEVNAPHVMLIPAREVELQRNGSTFRGYLTKPDDMNKEWFISSDFLLVGQI